MVKVNSALKNLLSSITKEWTLFLDRDGVINQKLENDYVKTLEEFNFLPGSKKALAVLFKKFGRTIIVTNQQGIGKGLMTEDDLSQIHNHMLSELQKTGTAIDKIYFCPHLAKDNPECRKPNIGMALQAKKDFPEIDFSKSIMVGDSISDIKFGQNAGMQTIFVSDKDYKEATATIVSLSELSNYLDTI